MAFRGGFPKRIWLFVRSLHHRSGSKAFWHDICYIKSVSDPTVVEGFSGVVGSFIEGKQMSKWILISCMALGLAIAGTGADSAHAQHGYVYGPAPHCHSHHGHGYPSGYRAGYSPYGYGVSGGYGYGSSYGSYYGSPGLSISRSTYYSGGLVPTPYGVGVGGYSNYGYRPNTLPRVQLRIGF